LSPPLSLNCSRHFLSWLHEQKLSLAISTYQTNRLFLIGIKPDGRLSTFERLFDRAMGFYASSERLFLATRYQLWQFDNMLDKTYNDYDKLYVPRVAHTTGDLDIHDLAIDRQGKVVFSNTLYSCLATISEKFSFTPFWKPPFISKLTPEDRCHLNGLAMRDGAPRYVTVVSRSDVANGWRARREDGGCVLDITSNETIATGLSMPHSPRVYQGKLWLLNSGTGELGYVNTGHFEPIAFCPGYLRGLAFHNGFAIVGLSKPRHNRVFTGLALDKKLDAKPICGVMVIELATGNTVHWLEFEGIVSELYDVQILPGVRQPMMLGFKSNDISRMIAFEEENALVFHTLSENLPTQPPATDKSYRLSLKVTVAAILKDFEALTFPKIRQLVQTKQIQEPLVGVVALYQEQPIGAIFGEFSGGTVKVLSWFVSPAHRHKGVGSTLLSKLEQAVAHCSQMNINFRNDWRRLAAIEHILDKQGWTPPQTGLLLCKTTTEQIAKADWLNKGQLPADFEIFPWSELSQAERNAIQSAPCYPPALTPFQEEDRIEYLNSLGLRYRGEVVGWMITHRSAPDVIQYSSLFVRSDLQRVGRAIPLLAASIKRQISSDILSLICQVAIENEPMVKFVNRRLAPYVTSLVELRYSRKIMNGSSTITN